MNAPFHKGRKLGFPSWSPCLLIGSIFYAFVLSITWSQPHLNWKNGIYMHKYRFIIIKMDNLCDTHISIPLFYIKPLIPLTKIIFFFLFFFFSTKEWAYVLRGETVLYVLTRKIPLGQVSLSSSSVFG